ncbi:hypothetical protein KC340_g44 [Hortaea werneckii]|nr:hypothetical protein KC340_g44 [Hortaea werneckii]
MLRSSPSAKKRCALPKPPIRYAFSSSIIEILLLGGILLGKPTPVSKGNVAKPTRSSSMDRNCITAGEKVGGEVSSCFSAISSSPCVVKSCCSSRATLSNNGAILTLEPTSIAGPARSIGEDLNAEDATRANSARRLLLV